MAKVGDKFSGMGYHIDIVNVHVPAFSGPFLQNLVKQLRGSHQSESTP